MSSSSLSSVKVQKQSLSSTPSDDTQKYSKLTELLQVVTSSDHTKRREHSKTPPPFAQLKNNKPNTFLKFSERGCHPNHPIAEHRDSKGVDNEMVHASDLDAIQDNCNHIQDPSCTKVTPVVLWALSQTQPKNKQQKIQHNNDNQSSPPKKNRPAIPWPKAQLENKGKGKQNNDNQSSPPTKTRAAIPWDQTQHSSKEKTKIETPKYKHNHSPDSTKTSTQTEPSNQDAVAWETCEGDHADNHSLSSKKAPNIANWETFEGDPASDQEENKNNNDNHSRASRKTHPINSLSSSELELPSRTSRDCKIKKQDTNDTLVQTTAPTALTEQQELEQEKLDPQLQLTRLGHSFFSFDIEESYSAQSLQLPPSLRARKQPSIVKTVRDRNSKFRYTKTSKLEPTPMKLKSWFFFVDDVFAEIQQGKLIITKKNSDITPPEQNKEIWAGELRRLKLRAGWSDHDLIIVHPTKTIHLMGSIKSVSKISHAIVQNRKNIKNFYTIERKIAEGGFSEVYLGTDKKLGEQVAIKVMTKLQKRNPRLMNAMRREIEILEKLDSSPYLVETLDIFETSTHVFLVMEYIANAKGLFQIIEEQGYVKESDARNIIRQVLQGIKLLHNNSVVHRDMKLDNILLASSDKPYKIKLCDFGLSFVMEEGRVMRATVGTPEYWAPEVFNAPFYDSSVDMFAIGVVTCCLLSGAFPFRGSTEKELLANIVEQELRFDGPIWGLVSDEAKSFVTSLLQKDPQKRLTAGAALNHRWITTNDANNQDDGNKSSLPHKTQERKEINDLFRRLRIVCMSMTVVNAIKNACPSEDDNDDGTSGY